MSKKYLVKVNGEQYEVQVLKHSAHSVSFLFKNKEYQVSIAKPKTTESFESAQKEQSGDIQADISGAISKIFVKVNDFVNAGDPILILEAMKMENVIKSKVSGKVKTIHVDTGELVNSNQLLVTIETQTS